jgi:hypothetical protein
MEVTDAYGRQFHTNASVEGERKKKLIQRLKKMILMLLDEQGRLKYR